MYLTPIVPEQVSPYASAFHNTMESWFYVVSGLVVVLAFGYTISSKDATLSLALDTGMVSLLVFPIVRAIMRAIRDMRASRHVKIPTMDERYVDQPVFDILADGSLRLLCSRWVLDEATSNAALGCGPNGECLMRRRQELPEEAFVPAGEAERLFRRGLRKIIVLSYGWLSYADPDPRGHRLASLRTYLRSLPDADELAIFWVGVCTYEYGGR